MTTKTQKLIASVYRSIPEMREGFVEYPDALMKVCEREEKQHRNGWRPAGWCSRNFSAADAARYFAVKWLHDYAANGRLPDISEYLSVKESCLIAACLVARNRVLLSKWAETVPAEFLALDYVEMMA